MVKKDELTKNFSVWGSMAVLCVWKTMQMLTSFLNNSNQFQLKKLKLRDTVCTCEAGKRREVILWWNRSHLTSLHLIWIIWKLSLQAKFKFSFFSEERKVRRQRKKERKSSKRKRTIELERKRRKKNKI